MSVPDAAEKGGGGAHSGYVHNVTGLERQGIPVSALLLQAVGLRTARASSLAKPPGQWHLLIHTKPCLCCCPFPLSHSLTLVIAGRGTYGPSLERHEQLLVNVAGKAVGDPILGMCVAAHL